MKISKNRQVVLITGAFSGMGKPTAKTLIQEGYTVYAATRLTQLVLPYMREKKAGKIFNISSMGGKIYTLLEAWYHASKHAVEGWSDCLRFALRTLAMM